MSLSFNPVDKNGRPRLFVGMHRPPMPTNLGGIFISKLRGTVYTMQGLHECWLAGEFDQPLYDTGNSVASKEDKP